MINKTIVVFAVIAGACLTLATDASAEKARGGACGADMAKFCKDVKPGGGRIADCLKEHEKDLSKDCVEQRAKASEKRAKKGGKHGKSARGGDQDRQGFKGAWNKGGKGGGGACVSQYTKGFALGFQRGFKMRGNAGGAKGKKRGQAKVCSADTQKLCGDVKPGEGRVRDCLLKNIGKLSDGCKARTEKIKERLEEKDVKKDKAL